jgi:hypothetical protein
MEEKKVVIENVDAFALIQAIHIAQEEKRMKNEKSRL